MHETERWRFDYGIKKKRYNSVFIEAETEAAVFINALYILKKYIKKKNIKGKSLDAILSLYIKQVYVLKQQFSRAEIILEVKSRQADQLFKKIPYNK